MQRIKKGDTVEVIAGKDRGERGEVIRMLLKKDRILVNGINIVKKHEKATQQGGQNVPAQIVEAEAPLNASNVMPVCPKCDQPTRVGFRVRENGFKTRVCKKCNADMD